jgi:nitrite reductase (cytochrome c-552)
MPEQQSKRTVVILLGSAIVVAGLAALLVNIMERKQEARTPYFRVAEINEDTEDPAVWGRNFPQHYADYLKTADQTRTRYGGSEALPHTPTNADPRLATAQSKLHEDPRLKKMWAGYAFAADFREERGHAYMLVDQRFTERVLNFKQPGTCLNCHASTAVLYRKLGAGDIFAGFEKLNKMPYAEATKQAAHPVACVDCHDPATMKLRITRPGFIEGIRAYKASQGVADYDVNAQATPQEMRSYVCGQCHVEYYFQGDEKRLTFPWHNGLKPEDMLAYYDKVGHKDFTHKETGAPVLKAQHPEFELFSSGVHARAGVACADCHMPYKRSGALKISDHHVQSPMLNINRACQGCHHFTEEEMKSRVETIQSRFFGLRNTAMDALMELIDDTAAARKAGVADDDLKAVWQAQRYGQFLLDYAEAENSTGFHSPQEAMRILGESINYSRKGQVALRSVKPRPRSGD